MCSFQRICKAWSDRRDAVNESISKMTTTFSHHALWVHSCLVIHKFTSIAGKSLLNEMLNVPPHDNPKLTPGANQFLSILQARQSLNERIIQFSATLQRNDTSHSQEISFAQSAIRKAIGRRSVTRAFDELCALTCYLHTSLLLWTLTNLPRRAEGLILDLSEAWVSILQRLKQLGITSQLVPYLQHVAHQLRKFDAELMMCFDIFWLDFALEHFMYLGIPWNHVPKQHV